MAENLIARRHIVCTVTNDLHQDQRMQRICQSLSMAGYMVTLVGRMKKESSPLPQMPYAQRRLACWFQRGKGFYIEYHFRLWWWLLWQPVQLVNAVDLDTISACMWAAWWKKIPVVFDAHEYFTEVPELVDRPTIQAFWRTIGNRYVPKVAAAYTVGPQLARLFSEQYKLPFETIRNVPLRQELSKANWSEKPILLYQGMLNQGRGLEALIESMQWLPQATLWLVGKGDVEDALRQMVVDLRLENRIIFKGFVAPSLLPALTRQATLGVNLLENKGLSYYFSLANKAFDYTAAGLPSLQMDFPEYRQLHETYHIFHLLEDLQASTIAKKVNDACAEPEWHAEQNRCLAAAEQLHWTAEEGKLLQVYRRVLGK